MIAKFRFALKRFFTHPLFLSFYLPSFLFSIAWGMRTPVLPMYASEISNSYSLEGLIMDHLGRKYAVAPSFVVMGVGLAVLPLTT